jgi:hypothetical protein
MGFIEPRNEKTKLELCRILQQKDEPLKLVYAKYAHGRAVDQMWRAE